MFPLRSLLLALMFSADMVGDEDCESSSSETRSCWLLPSSRSDDAVLHRAKADVEQLLGDLDVPATLVGRVKTPASLLAKAQRKGIAPDEVLDRLAMRIIVDDIDACDRVQAALHTAYRVVPGSQDDYIRHPKANGYQSLHMALHAGPQDEIVEVQVRTAAMHAHAEHGAAAHDAYKAAQAAQVPWTPPAQPAQPGWLVA